MAFKVCDSHVEQYHRDGYTVFRKVLPPSLIHDLRIEADKGREIARKLRGANAQRLQPLTKYTELNQKPIVDYTELPELVDAFRRVVGPDTWLAGPEVMGILYEPASRPWCTAWHRDFGPAQVRMDRAVFEQMRHDFAYFHQVNCALYEDNCTWYVPGSHHREDFADELAIADNRPPQIGSDFAGLSNEEAERFCLEYVESMPRAIRLHLDAGDFCLYRNHGWHLGNYVPSKKRATLHDAVMNAKWEASFARWCAGGPMEPTTDDMLATAGAAR